MKKISLYILLSLFSIVSFAQELITGLEGSGKIDNPVLIKSASDLKLLSEFVNSGKGGQTNYKHFLLTNDIDFSNEPLVYDLDLNGINESNFNTIGYKNITGYFFQGYFDGNNKTISGLKINAKAEFTGLFGYVTGLSYEYYAIKNLSLKNSTIEGTKMIGGIAAYAQYYTISNCNTEIDLISNSKGAILGGIVGYNYGNDIVDCYSKSNITTKGTDSSVGAILGAAGQKGKIEGCYSKTTISLSGDRSYAGGIASSTHSSINNCYSISEINISADSCIAGGLVGYITSGGDTKNSYSATTISANNTCKVGGFTAILSQATISNCYYIDSWSKENYTNNNLAIVKTENELQQENFVETLNNGQTKTYWYKDVNNKNYGFPILQFQTVGLKNNIIKNNISIINRNNTIFVSGDNLTNIKVIDIQSRTIIDKRINSDSYTLEDKLKNGIYIVEVKSLNERKSSKVIITQ